MPRSFGPRPGSTRSVGEPRNYTLPGTLGGAAAGDRMARIGMRRSFDDTRQLFIDALAQADAAQPRNEWLRRQLRAAQTPEDLWLLRSAVFAALRENPADGVRLRETLRRSLDGVMPGGSPPSGFGGL